MTNENEAAPEAVSAAGDGKAEVVAAYEQAMKLFAATAKPVTVKCSQGRVIAILKPSDTPRGFYLAGPDAPDPDEKRRSDLGTMMVDHYDPITDTGGN